MGTRQIAESYLSSVAGYRNHLYGGHSDIEITDKREKIDAINACRHALDGVTRVVRSTLPTPSLLIGKIFANRLSLLHYAESVVILL